MIELNKVRAMFVCRPVCDVKPPILLQKFRVYLLEQEKSMDILAYLLCYFLETKDKPGNEFQ